ncbi:hypothetical protein [Nonomuraea zeae]|uniref:Uncharacterized protein n=1 Tax=Nonomuraea zeae TaxID=1642303 RepID=A0A5S4FQS2_9ACTN|nr:hypothetical protein [Nonomuraea zeae]TMR23042.1 hypothetical protein ETD85_48525 [Nonomuraea zeae]
MKSALGPVRFIGLLLALTLAATVLMPASPAAAAIPGRQRVTDTSPYNSSGNPKVATASCPSGKKVIGMGGYVTDGNGEVVLNELLPDSTSSKVRATAWADESGYGGNWSVTAIAMCADPLPGLQRVSAQSSVDSTDKEVVVTCPSGKKALGIGARLAGAEGQVFLDHLEPFAGTSGYLHASEDATGTSSDWSITLVAMCADPVPGLISPASWSSGDSTSPKSVEAICPAGKVAITAGGLVASGVGGHGRNLVMIDRLDLPAALDRGGAGAVEAGGGASFSWHVVSVPQCAAP